MRRSWRLTVEGSVLACGGSFGGLADGVVGGGVVVRRPGWAAGARGGGFRWLGGVGGWVVWRGVGWGGGWWFGVPGGRPGRGCGVFGGLAGWGSFRWRRRNPRRTRVGVRSVSGVGCSQGRRRSWVRPRARRSWVW